MNNLQVFNHTQFGEIRTVTINHEPWFVGKDVAIALGYGNPQKAIRDHVDSEDATMNDSFTVHGTPAKLINESGLYSLIMSSKLPTAKQFKRWVTHDVLPSIRKTGAYGVPPEKLERLNNLQSQLDTWRELAEKFERFTAEDCRRAQAARNRYDKNRATRDECRRWVAYFEQKISDEIKSLEIE